MKKFVSLLKEKNACGDGFEFASSHKTAQDAWNVCKRPEWMIWALGAFGVSDNKKNRLFACWCVRNTPIGDGRTTWDLLIDERSKNAVIVAERFANGEANKEELAVARIAAGDAAWSITGAAAMDAAWAAVDAARDVAGDAAMDAARTAAWAARSAARSARVARDAARAAGAAAVDSAWDAQTNELRQIYGFPFAGGGS